MSEVQDLRESVQIPLMFGQPIQVTKERIVVPVYIVGNIGGTVDIQYWDGKWHTSPVRFDGNVYVSYEAEREVNEELKDFVPVNFWEINEGEKVRFTKNIFDPYTSIISETEELYTKYLTKPVYDKESRAWKCNEIGVITS